MMNMTTIDALFLPAVFFLGLITSIEDIRAGKIRNKWILSALIYGLAVFFVLAVWNFIADPVSHFFYTHIAHIGPDDPRPIFRAHWNFFWKTGLNSFLSLLLGFVLWKNSILSAGDAKLFFVYTLLIPVTYYWKSYLPLFPAMALFINVFIIILAYFFLSACFYYVYRFIGLLRLGIKKESGESARGLSVLVQKKARHYGEQIRSLAGFMSLFLIVYFLGSLAREYLSLDVSALGQAFFVLLIVFSSQAMKTLFKNRQVFGTILLLGILFCGYGLLTDFWITLEIVIKTLKTMILFMIIMSLAAKTIDRYIGHTASVLVPTSELGPRMVLDREFLKNIRATDALAAERLAEVLPGGLSEAQAGFVRAWATDRGIKNILVCRKFSFALWLFLAVLVTLLIKGSLVNFIQGFLT